MTQFARAGAVLIFVFLAAALMFVCGERRRTAIRALTGYLVVMMVLMALTGRDAWPLATFPMMANDRSAVGDVQTMIAFRAVTADGREWEIDPLAWSPLTNQEMRGWFENVFNKTTPDQRRQAGEFLLAKAERARQARRAHRRYGNERILGWFAAPDSYAYREVHTFPDAPYAGIRVYRLQWAPAVPPPAPKRQLLLEVRR